MFDKEIETAVVNLKTKYGENALTVCIIEQRCTIDRYRLQQLQEVQRLLEGE